MVPNSNGHQRRLPSNQHSKLSNSRRPRRDPRSLPGRWRWCDRPWLCDAQKASALHTLIRQRHPTPSCGGHAPTAERTMIPARMCLESLDRRPGIREQPGSKGDLGWRPRKVRFTPNNGLRRGRERCPFRVGGLAGSLNSLASKSRQQRHQPMDEQSVSVVLRQSRQNASGLSHSSLERNCQRRELRCCYLPRLSNMSRSK